jgi:acyl-coenzyme A thioesterase PaaI-like protein
VAFFTDLGDGRFAAGPDTVGPWDARHQHGGPPSALLGRAVELAGALAPGEVTRMSIDLLGPVPVDEVQVEARVLRPGRRVELVEATLSAQGRVAMVARAWRLVVADTAHVESPSRHAPAPRPDGTPPLALEGWVRGYVEAIEWRPVRGGFGAPGPALVWCRQRVPLLEGEDPSPLQRVLTVADSGSGLSSVLDLREWLFVNTDLTVHLVRPARGEWLCVVATMTVGPGGAATATTDVYDDEGLVAHCSQALVVASR